MKFLMDFKALGSLVMITLLGLAGCGGGSSGGGAGGGDSSGGGGGTPTATGVFLDSAVEGLAYVSGASSGVTNARGEFVYEVGKTVRFMVGDIVIGEAPGQRLMTPISLVAGGDGGHPTVLNIARFLQTLDEDNNPSNGIRISALVSDLARGRSIDFAQSTSAFADDGNVQITVSELTAATTGGARGLVSSSAAQAHLSATIWGHFSGSYAGTFSGGDSGTWNVTISSNGAISGSGFSNNLRSAFSVSGALGTDGTFTFAAGGTSTDATFSGALTDDFVISGSYSGVGVAGSFSGLRTSGSSGNAGGPGNSGGGAGGLGTISIESEGQVPAGLTPNRDFATINSPDDYLQAGWSEWIGNELWMVSFSTLTRYDPFSTVVTLGAVMGTMYECRSGTFGAYGDCAGATFDPGSRTVRFSNVRLQAPGFGRVITVNGTLPY